MPRPRFLNRKALGERRNLDFSGMIYRIVEVKQV
jgi:hypothetical protein